MEKVIIVSVHVRYFSFFSFFSLCQTAYVRLRRLHQVTSGYVSLRRRDGTWSSTISKDINDVCRSIKNEVTSIFCFFLNCNYLFLTLNFYSIGNRRQNAYFHFSCTQYQSKFLHMFQTISVHLFHHRMEY